jgi:hypothetical protein
MSDYHFFTDNEFAGPGQSDLIRFWDRESRQLRLKPRIKTPTFRFQDSGKSVNPIVAKHEDSLKIANFWNKWYKGSDWNFKCTYEDIVKWMDQGFILLIKKHDSDELVATFAFRKISGGIICGSPIAAAAVLDGLVVKPEYRKTGLVSFILAYIDKQIYSLPDFSRGILIWFREHDSALNAISQTPISIIQYMYIKLDSISKTVNTVKRAEPEIVKQFVKKVYNHNPSLFTLASLCTTDTNVLWFTTMDTLIAIADTHRVTTSQESIWEIVFAANREPPHFTNLQRPIENAALELPCTNGILFASNGLSRGNLSNPKGNWIAGKSGYLTTHVYNWMPPRFLTGDILFPHACI